MISCPAHSNIKIFMIVLHTNEEPPQSGKEIMVLSTAKSKHTAAISIKPEASLCLEHMYVWAHFTLDMEKYMFHNPYGNKNPLTI